MENKYVWLSQLWLMTGVISKQYVFGITMAIIMFILSIQDSNKEL